MKTASTLAAGLILGVVLISSASAQPQVPKLSPKGLNLKKLPQGMTQQQLQQRIAPALARLKTNAQAQMQQSQREAKAISDATANERAAVNAALNKDARYKTFIEQAKRISSGAGTNEAKAQQIRALAKANQAIFNDALKAAKINHSALQGKLRAIVPGITLMPDFAVRKGILRSSTPLVLAGTSPTTKEIVLKPPFTFEEFEADNGGIAASSADGDPNADDGKARSRASVLGVAGGAGASAVFGEIVAVPAGVKRVEFTIAAKTTYSGEALGALGVGIGSVLVGVEVQNEAANQVKNEFLDDTVVAPLAWYAEMQGGRTNEAKFSFDVPAKGGDYLVSGATFAHAVSGGVPGYAKGDSRAEIDRITVKYFYD
jgi:hypothetical protein